MPQCCLLLICVHQMYKVPAKFFGVNHLIFLKRDGHTYIYMYMYAIPHSEPCARQKYLIQHHSPASQKATSMSSLESTAM